MNAKNIGGVAAVAVLSVITWYAWLGWDNGYDVDAAGNVSGPYQAWQIAGAGVTLLAVLIGAILLRVNAALAAVALTLAFTAAWTWDAASHDDSGLFAVGAILLLAGLAVGSAVVAAVTTALVRRS